jgi:type I restriction enzyme M protein
MSSGCRSTGGRAAAANFVLTRQFLVDAASRPLDVPALESWLWEAACVVRGPLDAPKFKDYILPLIFLKRLSDVFDDEVARLAGELGDARVAAQIVEGDHRTVRFYIP